MVNTDLRKSPIAVSEALQKISIESLSTGVSYHETQKQKEHLMWFVGKRTTLENHFKHTQDLIRSIGQDDHEIKEKMLESTQASLAVLRELQQSMERVERLGGSSAHAGGGIPPTAPDVMSEDLPEAKPRAAPKTTWPGKRRPVAWFEMNMNMVVHGNASSGSNDPI